MTMKKSNKNERRIAVLKRRARVRELIVHGGITQKEMAVRLGVTENTISLDKKNIFEEWQNEDRGKHRKHWWLALKKAEYGAFRALDGFVRSQKNDEEIHTVYIPRKCPECKGTGWQDGDKDTGEWCDACDGDGRVIVEKVSRKVRGQAGDPSFLREYREFCREIIKLRGLYPTKGKPAELPQPIVNLLQINAGKLENASSEAILKAREAFAELTFSGGNGQVIEGEVVKREDGEN